MRPTSRVLALLGTSVIALTSSMAAAQEAVPETGETVVLDAITLTATSDTAVAADGYVATYNQVATKSDTPLAETQQSISVVTTQQMKDQGAETLGQALSYSAGVVSEPYGSDPRFDSPTIRGFEARSAQYVNGLRQLRYMGAPAYETYGIQQVEVLRGPSSSLYGAGAPSGIINQIQKRAQAHDFGEVGLGFDSNNSRQLFLDVNRAVSDTLALRFTATGRDNKEQIDELTNERGYFAAAARWQPTDMTTVDFIASYIKDSPISPTGVPYGLTRIADGDDLREMNTGQPDWDDSDRKMGNFGVELSHDLGNGWTLNQGFRYEKFDWDYTGTYISGLSDDGATILRGANRQEESTKGINLDTRLAGEVESGSVLHKLLIGIDLRKYDADTTTEFYTASGLDWRNPDYSGAPTDPAWYTSENDLTLKQIGIYAQDEIEIANWRASVALRHDRAEQTGTIYTNFAGRSRVDQTDNETTGRLGLSYIFANGVMPYVSYSTSFDPEIGNDDQGNALKPTTGKQWELGVKYEPTNFNGLFSAAIYDLRQENVTRYLGAGVVRQTGEVKSRGLELEATAEITEAWDLRASYAYNETEQVGGGDDGKDMPNAPKHQFNAWLDHDFGNGLRLGGGVRYIGKRMGDYANIYEMDSATLVDLGGSYTRDNIEASLNINNLTDKTYLANCGTFGCFYGEGRTVTAKVAYKW
ncbi:MAG: TonB-dependent siderophore receptor [Paracoccus sp.]|nr:TonB-dependent siderophore receptor [Paracoccus sp. (in: a-proteobacteria)]